MAVSFIYWDDCVEPQDKQAMWEISDVSTEWLDAGESQDEKIHLSRDFCGQTYLTQTEMRAVAEITVRRHFASQIDPAMICAIAELESGRQLFASRYDKKTKDTTAGIMQISPKTAEWLSNEQGYRTYEMTGREDFIYRPFVNVYFGAAYLKWLHKFDQKERSEEFVVRAYRGGTKKAMHKSTLEYWNKYLAVKETFKSKFSNSVDINPVRVEASEPAASPSNDTGNTKSEAYSSWDSRVSLEDMDDMWNHPDVVKEWSKSGERRGNVRLSQDSDEKPYLSQVELKAVAEIVLFRHYSTKKVKASVLCAIAEVASKRFVDGIKERIGIMGIGYSTALWLHNELGFKAYKVESVDNLCKPFVSMYFAAAYLDWLSEYEGRKRTPQFVVQAYFMGPENANVQDASPYWAKFEAALSNYEDMKREHGSCSIL